MSNIDIYTGKSNFNEIIVENMHNPTTYDELERFVTSYSPSETILISNMDEDKILATVVWCNRVGSDRIA